MSSEIRSNCQERVTLVEIILDQCSNTFSQGACTSNANQPCYNTYNTCTDICNFSCTANSYWFSTCNAPSHLVPNYTPNIAAIQTSATILEMGRSFSTRGRIKVTFQDSAHNDLGFDPYVTQRRTIPIVCAEDMPGTLFGRWIARVKYFENRKVNVYNGYADQPLCDFVKESYFIDSITGPNANCKVEMTLKDPLILADDKNAKCPSLEPKVAAAQVVGNEFRKTFKLATFLAGTDDDAEPFAEVGSYLLANNYLVGDPAQDAFFTRLTHICIDSEVMEVRAEINNATPRGWNIRLVDRGVCGSEITEHETGASINPAETFRNAHIADVMLRMLLECSEIREVSLSCCDDEEEIIIDYESFEQLRCDKPLAIVSEAIICEPTGLTTLFNEISDQFLVFLYYDAATGKIRTICYQPPDCNIEPIVIEQCSMASFSKSTRGDHYNQVQYNINTIDCSESPDFENLSESVVVVTADSLLPGCERRTYKTKSTKTINSRWINNDNRFLALANAERWLQLRPCPVEEVVIRVPIELGKCVDLGGYAILHHDKIQDTEGNYSDVFWLLKGKSIPDDKMQLTFERSPFSKLHAACFNCDTDCATLATPIDDCNPDACRPVF